MQRSNWFWNEGWDASSAGQNAAEWRALLGPDPLMAELWEDAGFTPQTAKEWIECGESPMGARGGEDILDPEYTPTVRIWPA